MYNINQIFIRKRLMNIGLKYKVHVDIKDYKDKPDGMEIKRISNRITKQITEVSEQDLISYISSGYTILPSIMTKGRLKRNFEETSFIFLDFDNVVQPYISYEDMLKNKFVKENAMFMYKTFSSTTEVNKYRIVFKLDKPIKEQEEFAEVIKTFLTIFPTADRSCRDVSRLFFGSSKENVTEINLENKVELNLIKNIKNNICKSNKDVEDSYREPKKYNYHLEHFDTDINSNEITNLIKQNKYIEYRNQILPKLDVDLSLIRTKKEMIYFINSLDMGILLGIPKQECGSFKCVLTEDNNPSSSIFIIPNKNIYIYKRFGDKEFTLTTVEVFKILLKVKDTEEVIKFFKKVFNIEYAIDYSFKTHLKAVRAFLEYFNTNTLTKDKSSLEKVLSTNRKALIVFIRYLLDNPYESSNGTINYLSAKSSYTMPKLIYKEYSPYLRNKANKFTNLLTYLKIIRKLEFHEYPKEITTYHIQNNEERGRKIQNVFALNLEFFTDLTEILNVLENECKYLIEMGHSLKGFTQDFVTAIEGTEASNQIYKHSKNKAVSENFSNMYNYLENYIDSKLKTEKDYIFMKDIKKELIMNGNFTKNSIDTHFKNVLGILINNLKLEKKKVSNVIKSEFDIDTLGFPYIIIKNK